MKIQCNCGAKYAFDVTPDMLANPVSFICPACGLDSSAAVRQLIEQQFAAPPAAAPATAARPAIPAVRMATPAPAQPEGSAPGVASAPMCAKHRKPAVDSCRMCGKPLCPQCMELFGYVCSPLCKARAGSTGLEIPVFEGQKSVRQARQWRLIGWTAGSIAAVLALIFGGWFYYVWFGCAPKTVFSAKFQERKYSGGTAFAGAAGDQLVYLHGFTLARHELKSGKQFWSRPLLDRNEIAATVEKQLKAMAPPRDAPVFGPGPDPEKMKQSLERSMAASMKLFVRGENIWVQVPGKLVHHDWATGKPVKEIPLPENEHVKLAANELVLVNSQSDPPLLTRIDVVTGESQSTRIAGVTAGATDSPPPGGATPKTQSSGAGLPLGNPERLSSQPMDPTRVAQQAQGLPYQAKVALPALVAANMNQARLLAELNSDLDQKPATRQPGAPAKREVPPLLIKTPEGYLQCTIKLLESRVIERVAMKAAPAKSALDGDIRASQSMEVANELLNEMQRSRGGDKVTEDLSRYQVTLQTPGAPESWTGEVIGWPELYPLKTVNVLASTKSLLVLDKKHQKKWQAALSYNVLGGGYEDEEGEETPNESAGQGPCVERSGTLYVFDAGMLNAFDLATGDARWRLPSVGILSLLFDEEGMIYVNTTTASHESLKYSRQIDLTQVPGSAIFKVNPKDGKVLWRNEGSGIVSRIAGKFIFTMASNEPIDEEIEGTSFQTGFEKPPFIRIRRLNPKNGKEVWEHFEERAPLDVAFEKNYIRLVFRKEVEVLKFPTF